MPVVTNGLVLPVRIPQVSVIESTADRALRLKDYLDLYSAKVNTTLTKYAERKIFLRLLESSVTINIVLNDAGSEEIEYEHTYPVISRVADPDKWVAPRGRIIYEPNFDKSHRHTYHANKCKPVELTLTIKNRHRWTLKADMEVSRYEVSRNEICGYIPVLNTTHFGPGDRFTIFHYFHHADVTREYPARIFFRTEDDCMRFHCVSIPLKLLAVLVEKVEERCADDYD